MDKKTTFMDVEPGDEIVISGIAGRFPESNNIKHLQENLFNKVDLGSDDERRWTHNNPDIPKRTGKINNIEKFDAEYFDFSFKDANLMDPMSRMLLEHTYEAIVDAGINPKDLRGTKTGVFVAIFYAETEKAWFYDRSKIAGDAIVGCSKSIFASRISYWLDITGPSYTVDTACSSSLFAVEQAYRSIQSGECDAAIVCGSNLCLHPNTSLQFARLGAVSINGFCKPFDVNANGYMRSEAVAVILLQKAKEAKRIYATLVYAKTNCDGFKTEGVTFPSSKMQATLLKEFYDKCGISPSDLTYVEAHGTGTKVGDPVEIEAIDEIFCKDRNIPLLIGSVKSNMGHAEPASGLCQIAKVLIAMETGMIPPNINLGELRKDIKAFSEGRIQVVIDPTPWDPSLVGISSFGFGGANGHILLRPHLKRKINGGIRDDDLPRLVAISGRTEQAVESFLNDIERQPVDIEYVRLLHDLHADDIKSHSYRGYVIIGSKELSNTIKEIQYFSGIRKPICFVFSGIGSQWLGMGEDLLQFPIFHETLKKCDVILKKCGIYIVDILTSKDKTIFNNITNILVSIVVMQIGLIDLLTSISITPDYVIGHSIGELCCGYITGNFTLEQTILSAYYIGLAINETKLVYAMVDIGLNYEATKEICPPDIDVICSNSPNSCTISGPKESVETFTRKLQINKIFTNVINCSNSPLHSRYLAPAKATILSYLNQMMPQTMQDSQIWRTLFRRSELSYAEYFTNNLLNPVFFERTARLIPENILTVEITPDGILQDTIKDLYNTKNIVLLQRDHENNVELFLQGVGQMYCHGLQPQLAKLYPAVEFPVSRGTPMISPSIKWKHSEDWYVVSFTTVKKIISGERIVEVNISDEDYSYMVGHIIDGKNLLPATGYLGLIWETVGMLRGQLYSELPIIFENVKFLRATLLRSQGSVELILMVQKVTGKFEILEGGNTIVTGTVRVPLKLAEEMTAIHNQRDYNEEEVMKTRDIYKELRLRGYHYTGVFQGLRSLSVTGRQGHIAWMGNWVAFMDNMLQMKILGKDTRNLYVPTGIEKLAIDVKLHAQYIQNITTDDKSLPARVYNNLDMIIAGGIEISGIQASSISRRKSTRDPILEDYRFVAHRDAVTVSLQEGIIMSLHLVIEYHQTMKINIIELVDDKDEVTVEQLTSPLIIEILNNLPLIQPNVDLIARTNRFDDVTFSPQITVSQSKQFLKDGNAVLVTGFNLLTEEKNETLKEILLSLKDDGFLLTREKSFTKNRLTDVEIYNLSIVIEKRTDEEQIILLKKKGQPTKKTEVIYVNNNEFSWLEQLKTVINAKHESGSSDRIIIVGEKDTDCGLLGLVNCLRKEPGGEIIRGMLIQDETAPKFSLYEPLYAEQLQADLILNVLRPGRIWGSYRHLPLKPLEPKFVYHAFVNQMVRGDMNSFRWFEGPIRPDYQHEDLIHIVYAPLNFKDIMTASGKLILDDSIASRGRREECFIGFEYVGINGDGRRVMGIHENRCISNLQVTDRNLRWNVPDEWGLEDAVTVPCIYGTCCYGLYFYGKMKKGDKILIHSGTGGVGQAAIHLALHEGCEIFTTVGTREKRQFIRDTFPSIPEDHIGNSRDTSFEQMILQQTGGRGVDIVLNSLAEEKLHASIRCLAKGGRFLEIGKFDFMANSILDLSIFAKGIQFYSVMLDNMFCASEQKKALLYAILAEALDNGVIKPISRKVFQKDQVETAFRYMAAGKHIGKVAIKIQRSEESVIAPILAFPRYYCLTNKTYVILGGLGGIGLELADWLVIRGAENLVLVSRSGIKNGYQQMKIEQWKSYGINVSIMSNIDVSEAKDCECLLRSAEKLAPVDAIFNLAVVLNDKIFPNHTTTTFQEPFKAKAWATRNLDFLSREICPHLRHFVVFSSVSCGRGNAGQSNYGMANSIMERICEKRSQQGLHGLAIQWGAIGDVGIVADMMDSDKEIVIGGTLQQKIISCIEKLEEFLLQNHPIVSSMVVAEKCTNAFGTMNIVESVANIMNLKDLNTVAYHVPLPELGMDSMMVVEIKQTLEREFDVLLTAEDIRNLSFAKLFEMFVKDAHNEESSKSTLDANEFAGIRLFFRVVGNEDIIPDVCIDLPTEKDKTKSEIFLLPGVDGCAYIFKPLINKIEAATTCLQYGTHNIGTNCTSIIEITNCLFEHILDKAKTRQEFIIVGYSFGTLIGIELARKLEEMNIQCRLILIDGAPAQLKVLSNQYLPFATINELQDNVLLSLMDILQPASTGDFLLDLNKLTGWDKKLERFLSHLPTTNVKLSIENMKSLCTTIYSRLIALQEYDMTGLSKIKSPVILLKPTMQSLSFSEEDYGLHKITEGNVKVHYIEGNHATILDSDKVIAVINEEIGSKILEI